MNRRTPARAFAAVLLVLGTYVFGGELLQSWVNLHLDAWSERSAFGSERDQEEWARVRKALAVAQGGWPWKASLYRDAARVELFGAYAGFVPEPEAGKAVLAALRESAARSSASGAQLILEIRGHVLAGDVAGAQATLARLVVAAPHARPYWRPLVAWLCERALSDAALQPLARAATAHYAQWDAAELTNLARVQVSVRPFLPAAMTP